MFRESRGHMAFLNLYEWLIICGFPEIAPTYNLRS